MKIDIEAREICGQGEHLEKCTERCRNQHLSDGMNRTLDTKGLFYVLVKMKTLLFNSQAFDSNHKLVLLITLLSYALGKFCIKIDIFKRSVCESEVEIATHNVTCIDAHGCSGYPRFKRVAPSRGPIAGGTLVYVVMEIPFDVFTLIGFKINETLVEPSSR